MKSFGPIMLAIIALGCRETAEHSGGALATPATDASVSPTTRIDAATTQTHCQTLCDYDGCRVFCNDGTPPVVPDEDPYD